MSPDISWIGMLILSPKTGPGKMLVLWDDNIRKGGSFYEKVQVHGRANRLCAEAGRVGHTCYRGMPQDGHL